MARVATSFREPEQPDLAPILYLHRGHDVYVTFCQTAERDSFNLCAVRASELSNYFPQFVRHLAVDAYFSINAFYRGARHEAKYVPQLPGGLRRNDAARWITSAFVDLDVHRAGISVGAALEADSA